MSVRFARLGLFLLLAAPGSALVVAACSSFSSEDQPAAGGDADLPDRSTEPAPDAAPGVDGSSDAGCADFALGEPFSSDDAIITWPKVLQNGAIATSGVLPDAATPTSSPAALYAHGTIPDAGDRAVRASATLTVPFLPATMQVRYALLVPASSAYAEVGCAIHFGADYKAPTFDVFMASGTLQTRGSPGDGGSAPAVHDLAAQPASDWIIVETRTTLDRGDAGGVSAVVRAMTRTGTVLGSATVESISAASSTVAIECGIGYADLGGGQTSGPDQVEVLVDDLSVTACKN